MGFCTEGPNMHLGCGQGDRHTTMTGDSVLHSLTHAHTRPDVNMEAEKESGKERRRQREAGARRARGEAGAGLRPGF